MHLFAISHDPSNRRKMQAEMLDNMGEGIHKPLPIAIVIDDVFTPVTARGDVIERVWEFDANRMRHARKGSVEMLRS